ncbi:M1 family metallopeptidase [Flammeovirgaceae bacterium SG7u.111]|nr:M1 family metallopeptidase [Flammeovirgaceae bacterium SG7u.132]WPO38635.1 M1 family metallopeptidase [Flammeovirgaceae bacterium SG7u.111]
MLKKLCATLLVFFPLVIFAQDFDLHVSREIKEAYDKGTRSVDGKPGVKYWHNTVDYTMEVTVDPSTRGVAGSAVINYLNNSPDDLNSLVVRLYYDVFKKGNARGMQVNPEDIGDGVVLSNLKVNGEEMPMDNPKLVRRRGTNLIITLATPLKTGSKVELFMDWEQKVPLTVRRTGAKDSTSFFIAYWYPQMSVYDDVFGWDMIDYTFDTEFYNNLGNYDVKITAPTNFLVWATGELQNATAILPEDIYAKYEKAKTATETIHVVDSTDLDSLVLKSGTWHYKASEVSDFAFAMSDHYLWDAASQEVSGNSVLVSTAFPQKDAPAYAKVTAIQQKTMKHFSEDVPGIPYPYPAFTTFIGLNGGGMEFPMMANNANAGRGVTIHEMFHTYFPMYVRINERRFAWMDEGWADFITTLVTHKFFKDEKDASSLFSGMKAGMDQMSGTIGDLPTVTSSQYMAGNYGYHSYTLPSFTYAMLYDHLGDELFLKCYREYIRRWAKKSPTPYDFFYTFENVSGQDLGWFWEPWYFGFGYSDVAVTGMDKGTLSIKNKGTRPVPVSVLVEYEDGNTDYKTYSVKSWVGLEGDFEVKVDKYKKAKFIMVNGDIVDVAFDDNFYPSLEEIYKDVEVPETTLGTYGIKEFPVSAQIVDDGGKIKLLIPEARIESYLRPKGENHFVSLDNSMDITLTGEGDAITDITIALKSFGVTIHGTKK